MNKPADSYVKEMPKKEVADFLKKLHLDDHPKTREEVITRSKQYGIRLGRLG